MGAVRATLEHAGKRVRIALAPLQARWFALEPMPRWLILIGIALLLIGLIVAYAWLPAARTRAVLQVRIPQLEVQLATMRNQANALSALAGQPMSPTTMRRAADVSGLQTIFGPEARIIPAHDGFQIIIPATGYASWWEKTGDAISRHALVLKEALLTRADGPASSASVVSVDMRLGIDAGPPTSPAPAVPAVSVK